MDARDSILQPWIRSAEVRGERLYENWDTYTHLKLQFGFSVVVNAAKHPKNVDTVANSVDPDQTDPLCLMYSHKLI